MGIAVTSTSSRNERRRAVGVDVPTCTCGQDLECCHQAHCPRCGRTLHPR